MFRLPEVMSPKSNQELKTVLKSSFLFTIVRHPLLRLVSAYRFRLIDKRICRIICHRSFYLKGIKYSVIRSPMLGGVSVTRYIVTVTWHVSRGQSSLDTWSALTWLWWTVTGIPSLSSAGSVARSFTMTWSSGWRGFRSSGPWCPACQGSTYLHSLTWIRGRHEHRKVTKKYKICKTKWSFFQRMQSGTLGSCRKMIFKVSTGNIILTLNYLAILWPIGRIS